MSLEEKIKGVLGCTAIGDAMGSATENLTFDQIREMFQGPLTELVKPGETAFALGNEAGEITDDFSQVYFIVKEILKNGGVLDREAVIRTIVAWSKYQDGLIVLPDQRPVQPSPCIKILRWR